MWRCKLNKGFLPQVALVMVFDHSNSNPKRRQWPCVHPQSCSHLNCVSIKQSLLHTVNSVLPQSRTWVAMYHLLLMYFAIDSGIFSQVSDALWVSMPLCSNDKQLCHDCHRLIQGLDVQWPQRCLMWKNPLGNFPSPQILSVVFSGLTAQQMELFTDMC